MRLSQFILTHSERIVAEWEAFARTLVPQGSMNISELRDHAKQMLTVIAHDMETPQSEREGATKSKGRSDSDETGPDTPAQAHGSDRADSGFQIGAMVSEYRALRASVIRLWTAACPELSAQDVDDLVRFSEAIDQALAESTARFADDLERTREIFLGVLGHDLRTPLGAIVTSAQFILEGGDPATARKMAGIIARSGMRMTHMVDDLLDFTRGRLGASMPVDRAPLDFAQVLSASIDEVKASRNGAQVNLWTEGEMRGEWDGPRLGQLWSNLLGNAIDHGSAGTPVTVTATGDADAVVCSVHNIGPAIPRSEFENVFNPLVMSREASHENGHLGLGLYIADQIVQGHGGTIEVASDEERGTTFTVRLPRKP